MLKVENLNCAYPSGRDHVTVISQLSMAVVPGKLVLLAGRNGIGKSTLIRTLSGLQPVVSGTVSINGQSLGTLDTATIAGLVTVMFSTPPQLEMTRVKDLVITGMQRHFSAFQLDLSNAKSRVLECLELCGVAKFADRDFASLSDGEKQKVMLARALAQDTPLMLLDEPLAFLDYPSRGELLQLLQKLCTEQQKTIIYSSHDLEIAMQYCDAMLLLKGQGNWNWSENQEQIRSTTPASLFA